MLDNLENVVDKFQTTLLVVLAKIEKLESQERPSKEYEAPNDNELDTKEIEQLTNEAMTSLETPPHVPAERAEIKFPHLKTKLGLGLVTLAAGLLAANLALFQWIERTGLHNLLGNYAPYVCAYGGFAAMIFGAMLINDFLVAMSLLKRKYVTDDGITIFADVEKEEEKQKVLATEHRNRRHKNLRRKTTAVALIIFLFMLCPMVVSSIVSYTATTTITPNSVETLDLYIDSFDATKDLWAKVGSTPYLDAQDEPNNYIYSPFQGNGSKHGDQIGDFGFENTTQTGTIISVKLRVYGHASTSNPDECYYARARVGITFLVR